MDLLKANEVIDLRRCANLSKTRVVLRNIGFGMVYKPISIFISFIVVPITISYLGEFNYGLWATILSIISWISFFDIGIGNGLRNHLAIAITTRDLESARKYIATSYIVIGGISAMLLLVLTLLSLFLDWQLIFNVSKYSNNQISLILLINFIFICVNFILRLVTTIYYALQRSSIIGLVQIMNQIFNLLGVYYLIKISYSDSLLGISLVYGMASVCVNIIFTCILFDEYKELRFKLIDFDIKKVGNLTNIGMQFFVIQLAAMIIFTTDNIIITRLFGPEYVTPYNVTHKIFNAIIVISTVIIAPIWSITTQAYIEKDIKWLKKMVKRLNISSIILFAIGLVILVFFESIIKFWLGDSYEYDINYGLVKMMYIYMCLNIWNGAYSSVLAGISKIRLGVFVTVFTGLLNIPLSIYLANNIGFGITGVIMATNVCLMVTAIISPIQVYYFIFASKKNNKLEEFLR